MIGEEESFSPRDEDATNIQTPPWTQLAQTPTSSNRIWSIRRPKIVCKRIRVREFPECSSKSNVVRFESEITKETGQWIEKRVLLRRDTTSRSSGTRRQRERISPARRNKLIRETFCSSGQTDGQVLERTGRESSSATVWNYQRAYIHIWNSGGNPGGIPLVRFSSGNFLRPLRRTTRWYASGLHQYGLRVIPCKPREAFFRFCPGFHLAGKARTILDREPSKRSVLSRYTWSGNCFARHFSQIPLHSDVIK